MLWTGQVGMRTITGHGLLLVRLWHLKPSESTVSQPLDPGMDGDQGTSMAVGKAMASGGAHRGTWQVIWLEPPTIEGQGLFRVWTRH